MKAATVTVRKALRDDVPSIVAFVNALAQEEGDHRALFTRRSCIRAGFGPHAAAVFLLATTKDALVGYASFFPGFDTGENYRIAFVMDLYVVPHYRRQGVATKLLRAVARHAELRPRDRLCWGLLSHRRGARAFYESLGAEKDGFVPMSMAMQALQTARPSRPAVGIWTKKSRSI